MRSTTAPRIRWGLVGTGQFASEVLVGAFQRCGSGSLMACVGSEPSRGKHFANAHGVPHAFGTLDEMLESGEIDAVYVAVPNGYHCEVAVRSARAGCHILCEKPLAPTVEEARQIVAACRESGVRLHVGLQLRFLPIMGSIRRLLRAEAIGTLCELVLQRAAPTNQMGAWRATGAAGSGVIADVGVHLLDLARWLVCDDVAYIDVATRPGRNSEHPDDTAAFLLRFTRGALGLLHCTREQPFTTNEMTITGTMGMLRTGPLRWTDMHTLNVRTRDSDWTETFRAGDPYADSIDALGAAIAGQPSIAASGDDALRLVELATVATASLRG